MTRRFTSCSSLLTFTLILSAVLLLAHLGHYALWDDEALTALNAEGILRTGDTTAVLGDNVVAYGGGILLRNLHDRSTPPLASYLVAPFLKLLGDNSLAARFPFALLGIGCAALLLRWLWRVEASLTSMVIFCTALLCNVSFFLFFRNCRYYGRAIFFSVACAYCYVHRRIALLSLSLILLLASNPLDFTALCAALACDYVLFPRRERRLGCRDGIILFVPLAVIGGPIVAVWNPFTTANSQSFFQTRVIDKIILFFRALRNLNGAEFAPLLLVLAAPCLYAVEKNEWLVPHPAALLVYLVAMTAIAPTPLARTEWSDIRYFAPTIPLCIAIVVLAIATIARRSGWLACAIAVLAFTTNVLHFGPMRSVGFRSTVVEYVRELIRPPTDPYTVALNWMKTNIPEGSSILVQPNHAAYPLMFHAPRYVYAWQIPSPPLPQFSGLPDIQIQGRVLPDYIIVFGPSIRAIEVPNYVPLAHLNHYWQDRHRPELLFHAFREIDRYDPRLQDIYVLKRRG